MVLPLFLVACNRGLKVFPILGSDAVEYLHTINAGCQHLVDPYKIRDPGFVLLVIWNAARGFLNALLHGLENCVRSEQTLTAAVERTGVRSPRKIRQTRLNHLCFIGDVQNETLFKTQTPSAR